jgi:hypothetical protein
VQALSKVQSGGSGMSAARYGRHNPMPADIKADCIKRHLAGEGTTFIGRRYGVSGQAINQLVSKFRSGHVNQHGELTALSTSAARNMSGDPQLRGCKDPVGTFRKRMKGKRHTDVALRSSRVPAVKYPAYRPGLIFGASSLETVA